MPIKDDEKRRAYFKELMRKRRAAAKPKASGTKQQRSGDPKMEELQRRVAELEAEVMVLRGLEASTRPSSSQAEVPKKPEPKTKKPEQQKTKTGGQMIKERMREEWLGRLAILPAREHYFLAGRTFMKRFEELNDAAFLDKHGALAKVFRNALADLHPDRHRVEKDKYHDAFVILSGLRDKTVAKKRREDELKAKKRKGR